MISAETITRNNTRRNLPNGWRWVALGDVCKFLDSQRIPIDNSERRSRVSGKKESELFPYYGANGQVGWIDDYIFDEPLILIYFFKTQRVNPRLF